MVDNVYYSVHVYQSIKAWLQNCRVYSCQRSDRLAVGRIRTSDVTRKMCPKKIAVLHVPDSKSDKMHVCGLIGASGHKALKPA